jgi:hypothetical protein
MKNNFRNVFYPWIDLVTTNKVMGKCTHDARILAVMIFQEVTHLLTFNTRDFVVVPNITISHTQEII